MPLSTSPRVVVADAQPLIAEAFERLLTPECLVVGRVHDGRALIDIAGETRPDVAVVDLALPVVDGLTASRRAKQLVEGLKIVIVTGRDDPALAVRAFRAGMSGYLLKRCPGSELLRAIREVMKDRTYVTPLITRPLVDSIVQGPLEDQPASQLTHRQREVLELLADGKSMKQAAAILHIGVRTVAFHKYRMMEQLKLRTNAELIRFAVRRHVV